MLAHAFCTRRIETFSTCVASCKQWLIELTSLSEKVKLMSELKLPGVTQASVAKKYGVSTSQVSRLFKKEDLVRDFESGGNRSRKRKRKGKKEDVGNALFLWFEQKLVPGHS